MRLPGTEDTIVALATPPGRGAIAIVRMSGPDAHRIAGRVLTPWRPTPRQVYRATMRDPASGVIIDQPVVTVYVAPRSYTGEDLVELGVHGGHVGPARALAALIAAGARDALPGEFTRRAVAAGKMDLLQAEAVGDLVDARSAGMHAAALDQLAGHLSRTILALRDQLLGLEAMIAYEIDFPEEDSGPVARAQVLRAAREVTAALDRLLDTAPVGALLHHGALVVIAGAPNTGKSSLFNAVLGSRRAIVTEIPGTTRDAIEAVVEIGRWPVRLVDTAGLRHTDDLVERLGIQTTERYVREADVVLACGDDAAALEAAVSGARALSAKPVLAIRTKSDLVAVEDEYPPHGGAALAVSAVTGDGLSALATALDQTLARSAGGGSVGGPMLTRERHLRAVRRAREEAVAFERAWDAGALPAPVAAVHLRAATTALEELIGAIDVEDVLDRVFSTFCVGK